MKTGRQFSQSEDAVIRKICIEERTGKVADALKKAQLEIAVSFGIQRGIDTIKSRMYVLKKTVKVKDLPSLKEEPKVEKVISELDILHILSNYDRKSLILIKSYIDFKIG